MRLTLLLTLPSILLLGCPTTGGNRHHPDGYAASDVHSVDLKIQTEDCRACHAGDLQGDLGPSCGDCHADRWKEDCVFCHGGDETEDGAPPRDLFAEPSVFTAHTNHVTGETHLLYSCAECHREPDNVLSPEHVFDDTHGAAEVDLALGLGAGGEWTGDGCSNVYCHGDGQQPGDVELEDPPVCGDCHAIGSSPSNAQRDMSGTHRKHLGDGVDCEDCHGTVEGDEIIDPDRHVDGEVAIDLPDGMTRSANGRCDGECHDEDHQDSDWNDD